MIDARTLRRLALAAALSGVVHAAVVFFGRIEPPEPTAELPPLAVRIVDGLPAARPPGLKPLTPRPRPRPLRTQAPRLAALEGPSPVTGSAYPDVNEIATVEQAPPDEVSAPAASSEPIAVATAPSSTFVPEPPLLRTLPRKGRITYNLVYGRDQFPVGRTVQTWQMDGTTYQLASRSETTGIVDLIRSQHGTYLSRGSLTRQGLRPDTFLMSRNRGRGTEQARAVFDWNGATVTLDGSAAPRNEKLPPDTQDILSLMYQIALDPPPMGRFQRSVTNGRGVDIYELDSLPEETIETPLGALRALPVRQVRKPGEESLELWFATEYRYLPVRIRFFNRDGEPQGEQIVTEIRLSEE
ncbi:MAG TPA: DUF3108 domain-containing protein [Burkholderiales bacterium]|nr:DUF3108 domain-containing protein [Burkholderiales bacterium]